MKILIAFLKAYRLLCFCTLITLPGFASAGAIAFDANDVSLLLPLKSGKIYPSISLTTFSKLLTEEVLQEVLGFENPQTPIAKLPYPNSEVLAQIDRWHVTSFRIDNCGDSIHQKNLETNPYLETEKVPEACQPRFRFVIQPINSFGHPLVTALHLSYKLDASALEVVFGYLEKIKSATSAIGVNTNGIPLSIHPGLQNELDSRPGASGKIAKLIKELFTKVQSLNSLDMITMTLNVDARHWKLVGGMLVQGHWTRFVTRYNHQLYIDQNDPKLGVEEISCNFYDICLSSPQGTELGNKILTRIFRPGFVKRPELEKQNPETTLHAQLIDNTRTHFFSTNCLSCHESSNYRDRNKINLDANYFNHPAGITAFTSKNFISDSPSSIINFGYEGLNARISTRTASETAAVADRINHSRQVKNPGFVPKNYSDFWNCLMNQENDKTCLRK